MARSSRLPLPLLVAATVAAAAAPGAGEEAPQHVVARASTSRTEAMVARGFVWLERQQDADGGWHPDGAGGQGVEARSRTEATGLALLAFVGAAQTHIQGPYRRLVGNAVRFLEAQSRQADVGIDLRGNNGGFLSHAVAATALCELYALTKSDHSRLRELALGAVEFTLSTQNRDGGGWSAAPQQADNLRVTAWQIMVLKSATQSGLKDAGGQITAASKFLDRVQTDEGSAYGMSSPGSYLGRKPTHRAFRDGARRIVELGPDDDPEYNFFATNVLHRYGGSENVLSRKRLIDQLDWSQASAGPDAGSWEAVMGAERCFSRLETTAYNLMSLETYYRYRPLFRPDDDAPPLPVETIGKRLDPSVPSKPRRFTDGHGVDNGDGLPTIDLRPLIDQLRKQE